MSDFKKGIVIQGGELAGSVIGVDTFNMGQDGPIGNSGVPYGYVTSFNNVNRSYGDTVTDDVEGYKFYNENFENMIDISSYFSKDGPVYSTTNLADIAIIDPQNGDINGYFSIYIDRPNLNNPSYINVYGKMKNSSGVVIGNFNSAGSIAVQMGSGFSEPKAYLVFCKNKYNDNDIFGLYVNYAQWNEWSGNIYHQMAYAGAWIDEETIYSTWNIPGKIDDKTKDKSPTFGPGGDQEGYGPETPGSGAAGGGIGGPGPTFDGTSDPWIPTPTKPGVIAYGLLNIYKADTGALLNLGRTLFPSINWPPSTGFSDLMEWIGQLIMAFSDSIWNKGLIDYIVSVHLIPTDIVAGNLEDIKVGPRTLTGILARPITDDVAEFDCGTVHIDEYYTNYVDYMTSCKLYLPFYGMVTIAPEYWQSADISVKYLWNVMDGSFTAQVFSTINRHQVTCTMMIGQYSGSACVHMPLSGANYANMFAQLAGSAAGLAAGASTGNVALAATSAMALGGAPASTGDMQTSNSYNASSAYYSHARPYLMIERPLSHFSTNFVEENGLPLIVTKKIGQCRGFTTAENAILDGIPCTADEKDRIRNYLKTGIIIRNVT